MAALGDGIAPAGLSPAFAWYYGRKVEFRSPLEPLRELGQMEQKGILDQKAFDHLKKKLIKQLV